MFLELFFRNSFFLHHLSNNFSDDKYSGTPLPTSPNSKTIQDVAITQLCLDALFGHFKQSANKPSLRCQSKSYIAPPKSITKVMDGLFKYNGDRA